MSHPHVAVIGMGPIGIDMAINLLHNNYNVTIIEKGDDFGDNMSKWKDVVLFSPNALNMSIAGIKVLQSLNINLPDADAYPTCGEFMEGYLKHLSSYLVNSSNCEVLFSTEVVSVSRTNLSKGSSIGRHPKRVSAKFNVLVSTSNTSSMSSSAISVLGFSDGDERSLIFDSGCYGNPNFMGPGGMPAMGERQLRKSKDICYYIPSFYDTAALSRLKDRPWRYCVIGCGTSAITSIKRLLDRNAQIDNEIDIVWVTRCPEDTLPFTRIENDPLPQRDELFQLGNELCRDNRVAYYCNVNVSQVAIRSQNETETETNTGGDMCDSNDDFRVKLVLENRDSGELTTIGVDAVIANVGYRPDYSFIQELQVHTCYATEGPMKLAAALLSQGGSSGDCLAQVLPGEETLSNPEPRFFIVGLKSYGRGSAFLLRIGYEQVQHVLNLMNTEQWR